MTKAQKIAFALGLLGLIPFLAPALLVPFVTTEFAIVLETIQFAYAGLIITFMGGVHWGYAVKQGDTARKYQFITSVISTLILFATLFILIDLKPHHITGLFCTLLLTQAIIDQKTYTEKWFLKLRWILTSVACLSLIVVAVAQYL